MKYAVLVISFCVGTIGCEKKEDVPPAPPLEKAELDSKTDPKAEDAGVEEDAGVPDPFRDHVLLTSETPVDEIKEFLVLLKNRIQEIELREREVIQREQMVASLEAATMQQVDVLWKLKSQVSTLLEKVGEDFKDERQEYEQKLKKEEDKRLKKEKEVEAARQKKAEELKRVSEEMSEERERRIVHLTATIKGMRASAGAGMLASMDEKDAVAILRQLGARQAAALLGGMPADKAARLAEAMLGPKPISPDLIDNEPKEASAKPEEVQK